MKTLPVMLVGLVLACERFGVAEAESQGKSILPCDKRDHAAQRDLAANALRSRLEREECRRAAGSAGAPAQSEADCVRRVLADRDAYVFERCKLPPGSELPEGAE